MKVGRVYFKASENQVASGGDFSTQCEVKDKAKVLMITATNGFLLKSSRLLKIVGLSIFNMEKSGNFKLNKI